MVATQRFLCFSPRIFGERWTHFDEHIFSNGLVQPPTSEKYVMSSCWFYFCWETWFYFCFSMFCRYLNGRRCLDFFMLIWWYLGLSPHSPSTFFWNMTVDEHLYMTHEQIISNDYYSWALWFQKDPNPHLSGILGCLAWMIIIGHSLGLYISHTQMLNVWHIYLHLA